MQKGYDPLTNKSNMSIIDKIKENIKSFFSSSFIDELFWILLVIFVAIGAFSLGVRSEREQKLIQNPIKIEQSSDVENAWIEYVAQKKSSAEYFASKNGTVYYPLACPSGDRILQENRVYFSSEEEARGAGYKQSARCN